MKTRLHIEICTGTTCFVMGAGHLMELPDLLPENWRGHVEISGVHCLDLCTSPAEGKPPFVRINGQVLSGATVESVLDVCREWMEKEVKV